MRSMKIETNLWVLGLGSCLVYCKPFCKVHLYRCSKTKLLFVWKRDVFWQKHLNSEHNIIYHHQFILKYDYSRLFILSLSSDQGVPSCSHWPSLLSSVSWRPMARLPEASLPDDRCLADRWPWAAWRCEKIQNNPENNSSTILKPYQDHVI